LADVGLLGDALRLIVGLVRTPFILAGLYRFLLSEKRAGKTRERNQPREYRHAEEFHGSVS
jgi:hypothetical protein